MAGGKPKFALCSRCGVQLVVPPLARNIRCAMCHGVTYVGKDPVGHAVGFIRSIVSSFAGSGSLNQPAPYYVQPGVTAVSAVGCYPAAHGKKRALLVGVSYASTRHELKGTVNDVNCLQFLLSERFGFPKECILVLTEEERDLSRRPTKKNLRSAMRWLVHGCTSGDSLVFHFSGHGIRKLDTNYDEVDGYDEALCPMDFESNGPILDDEINETIVRPLVDGVKLHAIVDTCHSGTILDLPYLCRISRTGYWLWENHTPPSGEYKGTSGGIAILISGCDDDQTSLDTTAFAGSTSTGAMTYSFIQAVESEPGTTYGRLLNIMRSAIRENKGGVRLSGPIAALMRRVLTFGPVQEPQLSCSQTFDIYRKPFLL